MLVVYIEGYTSPRLAKRKGFYSIGLILRGSPASCEPATGGGTNSRQESTPLPRVYHSLSITRWKAQGARPTTPSSYHEISTAILRQQQGTHGWGRVKVTPSQTGWRCGQSRALLYTPNTPSEMLTRQKYTCMIQEMDNLATDVYISAWPAARPITTQDMSISMM